MDIKEQINQFLQLSEEELDGVLFTLKEKSFLNPEDNSLELFINWLSIAYGWGEISGIKKVGQELRDLSKSPKNITDKDFDKFIESL